MRALRVRLRARVDRYHHIIVKVSTLVMEHMFTYEGRTKQPALTHNSRSTSCWLILPLSPLEANKNKKLVNQRRINKYSYMTDQQANQSCHPNKTIATTSIDPL